jgi:hypothetical protein
MLTFGDLLLRVGVAALPDAGPGSPHQLTDAWHRIG